MLVPCELTNQSSCDIGQVRDITLVYRSSEYACSVLDMHSPLPAMHLEAYGFYQYIQSMGKASSADVSTREVD